MSILEPVVEMEIEAVVNGAPVNKTVPVRRLLSDFLRDDLGLVGTHVGCEQGVCGACTILVNDQPARSCLMLAVQAHGAEVTTVEGITPEHGLSRMQQAFRDCHGLQCGYCTPGFLVTLAGVDPADFPDDDAIRELLSGVICRCTGYANVVDAVNRGWERTRGGHGL